VDCGATGIPGKTCWGYAEGLLNPKTGLLSNDAGIQLASYMIRCALAPTDSVNLVDYTGHVRHLPGELSLATSWKVDACEGDSTNHTGCQERISACLMTFVNGFGQHVKLEMNDGTTTYLKNHTINGTSDKCGNGGLTCQEAAFYGNLFVSPPQTFFALGDGSVGFVGASGTVDTYKTRTCSGYSSSNPCPFKMVGSMNTSFASFLTGLIGGGGAMCVNPSGNTNNNMTGTTNSSNASYNAATKCYQSKNCILGICTYGAAWNYAITSFTATNGAMFPFGL
jgi:hypothetical protein